MWLQLQSGCCLGDSENLDVVATIAVVDHNLKPCMREPYLVIFWSHSFKTSLFSTLRIWYSSIFAALTKFLWISGSDSVVRYPRYSAKRAFFSFSCNGFGLDNVDFATSQFLCPPNYPTKARRSVPVFVFFSFKLFSFYCLVCFK